MPSVSAMISLAATVLSFSTVIQAAPAAKTVQNVQHTFYGYPDNDPAGAAIAYDCGRGSKAGGTGTYADPLTMATAPGEFEKCEIVWDTYTEKYLRFEDTCAQCITDWKKGIHHIDIWTGSSTHNGGSKQIGCENNLTPEHGHSVVRGGSKTEHVNTGPLYSSNTCHKENVYPNSK